MQLKIASACYYPSTVLMVDDNPRFLSHLSAKLDPSFHFKLLTDPREAVVFAEKESLLEKHIQTCFSESGFGEKFDREDSDVLVHQYYQGISLENLSCLVGSADRFNELSVIVVDYAMPGMNGVDLCRVLSKHPAKKILLTGEADHRIAVDAFNEGLIDRFLLKHTQESQLYEALNQAITEMQEAYFAKVSKRLLLSVRVSEKINNAGFLEIFNRIFQEYRIVEYYLLTARGAFLLVDESGKAWVFLQETFKAIDSYVQMVEENSISDSLRQSLSNHHVIPYLLSAPHEDLDFQSWENHLLPAECCESEPFLWALTPGIPAWMNLKIKPYGHFIEEHLKHEGILK
jgi:CheY-like chemotaxis protein